LDAPIAGLQVILTFELFDLQFAASLTVQQETNMPNLNSLRLVILELRIILCKKTQMRNQSAASTVTLVAAAAAAAGATQ